MLRRGALTIVFAGFFYCWVGQPATAAEPHHTKAEYRKIFSEAIARTFTEQKGSNICLPPIFWRPDGSIELNEQALLQAQTFPTGQAGQMKALEDAGLVASTTTQRTINNKPATFLQYTRTPKGEAVFTEGRFCYARADLGEVTKWRGPAIFGEYQIAVVYYRAKISNVADWASLPSIQAAFPTVKAALQDDPKKSRQAIVDLTSEGWEVSEWSRLLQ